MFRVRNRIFFCTSIFFCHLMCLSLDFGDMGQLIVSEFVCFLLCWLLRSHLLFLELLKSFEKWEETA
jgi:hypothetical protein